MNSRDNQILSYSNLIRKPLISDSNTLHPRWTLLILISIISFIISLSNSLFSSLQTPLATALSLTTGDFQILQQAIFGLSAFIPIIMGLLIDYYDFNRSYTTIPGVLILSQGFLALGAGISNWPLIVLGKILSASAGATLNVLNAVFLTKWFAGKELSLAFGTSFAALQAGTLIGKYSAEGILNLSNQLYMPFLLGIFLAIISLLALMHILGLTLRADRQLPGESMNQNRSVSSLFRSLQTLRTSYILVVLGISCYTGAFYGLSYDPIGLLVNKFNLTTAQATSTANLYTMIFPGILAGLTGYFIDQIGMRVRILAIIFGLFFLCAGILTGVPGDAPSFIVILLCLAVGIQYGVFQGILWPCVALTSEEKMTGVAFGIVYSVVNFVLWAWYQVSLIPDTERLANDIIVIVVAIIGGGLMYWLFMVDKREEQRRLERSGTERGALNERTYKSPIYDEEE